MESELAAFQRELAALTNVDNKPAAADNSKPVKSASDGSVKIQKKVLCVSAPVSATAEDNLKDLSKLQISLSQRLAAAKKKTLDAKTEEERAAFLERMKNPEKPRIVGFAYVKDGVKTKSPTKGKKRRFREQVGEIWEDRKLAEWPDDDYRVFVGNLDGIANTALLHDQFKHYKNYNMARVVRCPKTGKARGYGFVSFSDPFDMAKAMKEMEGKIIGNRPMVLRKSTWKDKDISNKKAKKKMKKKPINFF